jgi:hypothetical protein
MISAEVVRSETRETLRTSTSIVASNKEVNVKSGEVSTREMFIRQ